jgi:deoxyribose-phosphate aldolase
MYRTYVTIQTIWIFKRHVMKPDKKAKEMSAAELASYIDQSVLKPEFTEADIRKYIKEGIDYGCKTVCINPASIDIARELCRGTNTGICVVCDFPFGASSTGSKVKQAEEICKNRDVEDLDFVSNYGWIRSGKWKEVETDIKAVADVCHLYGSLVKVIFETDALSVDEVAKATDIACNAGVDFVKTSTGFFTGSSNRGAAPEIVQLMIDTARGRCKVKGAGGIRDQSHFFTLIDMGIDRMGIGYRSTPVVLGLSGHISPDKY